MAGAPQKDSKDYTINRSEEEKIEYDPYYNGKKISTLDALLQYWDKVDHESFLSMPLTWKECLIALISTSAPKKSTWNRNR